MAANQDLLTGAADILVVDDEITNLRLLTSLLTQAGYQVRAAEKPGLAIESALVYPPSLILLDVMMPEMDGFEVCQRLREHELTRDIPIIFVSALQEVDDKLRGFEAGGVDFISKPYQKLEVLARVKTHLQLREMLLNLDGLVNERTAELMATNQTLEEENKARMRAQQALSKSEEKFRAVIEQSPISIQIHGLDGKLIQSNPAYAKLYALNEQTLAELYEKYNVRKDEQAETLGLMPFIEKAYAGEDVIFPPYEYDGIDTLKTLNFKNPISRKCWVQTHGSPIKDEGGNVTSVLFISEDISERVQAGQKIEQYQAKLKALASQLTIVEEMDRRRLADQLHDQIGQSLALARIQLAAARNTSSESERDTMLEDVSQTLLESIQATRSLVFDLSSPLLREIGLGAAISEFLEKEVEGRHGIEAECREGEMSVALAEDTQVILFRNVRELLNNVIRHANASQVVVRLEQDTASTIIFVEDDGIGFDAEEAFQQVTRDGGFGLFSIQEGMSELGGSLEIHSKPGKGSQAILIAPHG
jgi:signal transduction histidine kinase